jgi:hypothetical protein
LEQCRNRIRLELVGLPKHRDRGRIVVAEHELRAECREIGIVEDRKEP